MTAANPTDYRGAQKAQNNSDTRPSGIFVALAIVRFFLTAPTGTNNINHLTTDVLADFAGQAAYHSSRAEVERVEAS